MGKNQIRQNENGFDSFGLHTAEGIGELGALANVFEDRANV
jgi:hypothetical protein